VVLPDSAESPPTGKVWASPSTWYRLVRQNGWRRPRLPVHPAKPQVGLRTTRANEMWHIDTTVIRLLDGTRAYLAGNVLPVESHGERIQSTSDESSTTFGGVLRMRHGKLAVRWKIA